MNDTVGQLLQVYASTLEDGNKSRRKKHSLQDQRRDRLMSALAHVGNGITREIATVLADGLAMGHLAVTDSSVYLINDGENGIKAECKCKTGTGGCEAIAVLGVSAIGAFLSLYDETRARASSIVHLVG